MNVIRTAIPDVLLLEPRVFGDERGFFFESYNEREFERATGVAAHFVQDNYSRSARNVLRGLHYQVRQPQGKLVRVTVGEVFDVAVDLRRSSPTFGRHVATRLSATNKVAAWIPAGFAHGFLVTSDYAEFQYKTTDYWSAPDERCIAWDDSDIGIEWPLHGKPVLSLKDREGVMLQAAEVFP